MLNEKTELVENFSGCFLSKKEQEKISNLTKELESTIRRKTILELEIELIKLKSLRAENNSMGNVECVKELDFKLKDIKEKLIDIRKEELFSKPLKPNKDELLSKLEELHHMEKTGQFFGVSSSAIRQWCKQFNIDYHKYSHNYSIKIVKICPTCGKEFTTTEKENKTYCSKECSTCKKDIDLDEVCRLHYEEGISYRQIAKMNGITHQGLIKKVDSYFPIWKSKKEGN